MDSKNSELEGPDQQASSELPVLELTSTDPSAGPSASDLAEMVVAETEVIRRLKADPNRRSELVVHDRILRMLHEQLHAKSDRPASPEQSLQRAEQLANILVFDVPPSHREKYGAAVTRAKRAAVKALKPLHVELLRPQHRFNAELVSTLKLVLEQRSGSLSPHLSSSVRTALGAFVDPTAWQVSSHRRQIAAAAVGLVKKSYLRASRPLLERILERQRAWNEAAMSALLQLASWNGDSAAGIERIGALQAVSDPLALENPPRALVASSAIWSEVFRRQTAFNREVTNVLARAFRVEDPAPRGPDYQAWCAAREPELISKAARAIASLERKPLFSIVTPTYETPEPLLRACIESVLQQSYSRWEFCILDDGSKSPLVGRVLAEYAQRDKRIKVRRIPVNGGIACATNAAIEMASGDFVCFLDHDDVLAPHALAEVARRIDAKPESDVLYSDEDHLDMEGRRSQPFFKPDWSPDLLHACNYICHFLVIRRTLLDQIGRLREGFDGSQDYELILRASEKTQRIEHIAEILYHWRAAPSSTAQNIMNKPKATDAGIRALSEHLSRARVEAVVESPAPTNYRVRYPVQGEPLVSIVVPFKDKVELLKKLVPGLLHSTRYKNFELLLVSNNSCLPETSEYLASIDDPRVRKLTWDYPFNYSAINNFAAQQAKGELFLFLNNDIEVLEPDWLNELVSQALRPEIGAVGPKLLFPDGSIQHAGVVVGLGGYAGHPFARMKDGEWTTFGSPNWTRNYLAVTSACVIMRRGVFEAIGGYNEAFALCGGDVDLCLRVVKRGLRVLYTPHAKLIHDESSTRKLDAIPEGDFWASYAAYRPYLRAGDPFYNPNLSLVLPTGALRGEHESAEAMAVRVLAHDLPSARKSIVSEAVVKQQAGLADFVTHLDHSSADVSRARKESESRLESLRRDGRIESITWLVPYFRHPYGGVHTIFRFGDLLRKRHGVRSHFVIYDNPQANVREAEARVSAIFDELPGTFSVLRRRDEIERLAPCDLVVATLWTSAYFALRCRNARVGAYFVQDFEPAFYAAGTFYALAEQTYRMGLYGIFNTKGLHDYVTSNYPMRGAWFEPSVDRGVFHANRPEDTANGPVRVFFYGRPSIDRNAFALGAAALKRLKQKWGKKVEIVTAGEEWQPEAFGLGGVLTNLGILPYEKTADLYRTCHVGLCFMFTKHPSYLPFELMACGVTVVTNDNPANLWLLEHDRNCLLAEPTLSCVSEQLDRAVGDRRLRASIGGAAVERLGRSSWEEQVDKVYSGLLGGATLKRAAGE